MKYAIKKEEGITLIVLVITIIILIILAGIVMNMLMGESSILNKTNTSKIIMGMNSVKEQLQMNVTEGQIDVYTNQDFLLNGQRAKPEDLDSYFNIEYLLEYEYIILAMDSNDNYYAVVNTDKIKSDLYDGLSYFGEEINEYGDIWIEDPYEDFRGIYTIDCNLNICYIDQNGKVYLDGIYTIEGNIISPPVVKMVARIDDVYYPKLQYAFNAVPTTGVATTVHLLEDINEYINVDVNKNIVLELDDHSLSGTVDNSSTIKIKNGAIMLNEEGQAVIENKGNIIFQNMEIGGIVSNDGTIEIYDSSLHGQSQYSLHNNGTFIAENTDINSTFDNYGGDVYIKNVTMSCYGYNQLIHNRNNGYLEIQEGCTFVANGLTSSGLYTIKNDDRINIEDYRK